MAWKIEVNKGLRLPQIQWALDAAIPAARSFISHAHSDHIAAHKEVVCSKPTARLLRERLRGKRILHALDYGVPEQLTEDASITLYPAGHILGSAQSLITHKEHGKLLYTGDFKFNAGSASEACEFPQADLLIMETTFGLPRYIWPDRDEVFSKLITFCKDALATGLNPVILAYNLGKAQEVIMGLSQSGIPIMIHEQGYRFCKIYEELGIKLPEYKVFDPLYAAGHIIICPPHLRRTSFLKHIPAHRLAVATGWALDTKAIYRYGCHAAFALSDHADYAELLACVKQVNPKRVLTVHGFAREFAETLRAEGIEAWEAGKDNQLDLPLSFSFAKQS
jgi:Cft2 family RNA processing exonuclease